MDENLLCSPNCEHCAGCGYYRIDVPKSSPNFGKIFPCPNRADVNQIELFDYLGIVSKDLDREWTDFKLVGNLEHVLDVVKTTLEKGYGWIYIWGDYGQGKTSLLKTAVSQWYRDHSQLCGYVNMSDLIEYVREGYDHEKPTIEKRERVELYTGMDLLCIDEIDRVRSTEFMEETKFTILNRRYDSSTYKTGVTIMCSNSEPRKLGSYLASRIMDQRHHVLHLDIPDLRPVMQWDEDDQA